MKENSIQCVDCKHIKGNCDCYCCCSISKIGCPSCIGPVLAYRGIRKLIHKLRKKE